MIKGIDNVKTENTCVNCAALECNVRYNCEDNELPNETQVSETVCEDTDVAVQVLFPKLAEKASAENWL